MLELLRIVNGYLRAPLDFMLQWLYSRHYDRLLLGIPALLGLLALAGGTVYAILPSQPVSLDHYLALARTARQAGRSQEADLYVRKATLAQADRPAARYKQALLLGQSDSAMEIIRELAPVDGKGYPPARVAMIKAIGNQLLASSQRSNQTLPDSDQRAMLYDAMEAQANKILQEVPADSIEKTNAKDPASFAAIRAFALKKLVLIRIDHGDGAGALEYLAELVQFNPASNLLYGKLLLAKGDQNEAHVALQAAVEHHQQKLATELPPERRLAHQIQMASALAALGQYEQAAVSLYDDRELPTDAPRRAALGDIFYAWSESVQASSKLTDDANTSALSRKLELLDRALSLRPNDSRVLQRIATIAGTKGESGEQARLALKKVLASGTAPAVVHFVLGVNELAAGNLEQSLSHFRLADKVRPQTPITLNNLAYLLSRQDSPDLDGALDMINQAISLKPDIPEFYDTRGMIYVMLERWSDAIGDLEKALRAGVDNQRALHEWLAQAYGELGDDELASMHREHAAQLTTP